MAEIQLEAGGRQITWKRPWLYPKQTDAIFAPARWAFIEGSTKAGKAQPLESTVHTPTGPTTMGELKVGDRVLTPDGGIATVLETHPQGEREVVRLTFSDGAEVECDLDHRWLVEGYERGRREVTARELLAMKAWRRRKTWVPQTDPVCYPRTPVPIDPYLLGVLIGDGALTQGLPKFSSSREDVVSQIRRRLNEGYEVHSYTAGDHAVTAKKKEAGLGGRQRGTHRGNGGWVAVLCGDHLGTFDGREDAITARESEARDRWGEDYIPPERRIVPALERLGLSGCRSFEKFIPDLYRYNSETVRRELMRGLMDADGTVTKHGQPSITQTSRQLAEHVTEVVESLGGSVSTAVRDDTGGRRAYRQSLFVRNAREWFADDHKRRCARKKGRTKRRTIRSVERVGVKPCKCITISTTDGLYLTDRFAVTHNSDGAAVWLLEKALQGEPGWNFWYVSASRQQVRTIYRRVKSWLSEQFAPADWSKNDTRREITLLGRILTFQTAKEPDNLYGDDVYAVVLDEASRCKRAAWQAVRTTLSYTGGPARIMANVRGRTNWHYEKCRQAENPEPGRETWECPGCGGEFPRNHHYAKLTAWDAVDAGILPEEEVKDAERTMDPDFFRQLYLSEPSEDGGNPFGIANLQENVCVLDGLSNGVPQVWGWDLGEHHAWSVGVAFDAGGRLCRFERWQEDPESTIEDIINAVGSRPALIDASGKGDPIVYRLRQKGGRNFEGFSISNARKKQQLMRHLKLALKADPPELMVPRREADTPASRVADELMNFTYEYTETRTLYKPLPGNFDDCVDAMALAAYEMEHGQASRDFTPAAPVGQKRSSRWREVS